MASFIVCPKCDSEEYHRSHPRNSYEKLRKAILRQRPYRCHECAYRGWVTIKSIRPKLTGKRVAFYMLVLFLAAIIGHIIGTSLN